MLVSAFTRPHGRVAPLWRAAQARRYRLLLSPAIVREVARVLREDSLWEGPHLIRQLKRLSKKGEIVVPHMTIKVIHDDPPDNCILECAIAGHADSSAAKNLSARPFTEFILSPATMLKTSSVAGFKVTILVCQSYEV